MTDEILVLEKPTLKNRLAAEAAQLQRLYENKIAATKKFDAAKAKFQKTMGKRTHVYNSDGVELVTWDYVNSFNVNKFSTEKPELYQQYCHKFDLDTFKKDNPELHSEYSDKTQSRQFRVKAPMPGDDE